MKHLIKEKLENYENKELNPIDFRILQGVMIKNFKKREQE